WHELEHGCFLVAALLFWWPVIEVWPSVSRWPRWTMIPYLLLADLVNTALSAVLSFSTHVLYRTYEVVPRLWCISAIDDQATAGAIMWVPGSIAFLVPAVFLSIKALEFRAHHKSSSVPIPKPQFRPKRTLDVLRVPIVGRVLRSIYFRRAAQATMLALAAAVVVDGLMGTPVSTLNLAGALPWTYWRGLAVISLLAVGNCFCMVCPFTLPRELARRVLPARYRWPRGLRSKWIAIGLLLVYLWAYEAFSLWDSPWWTAWLVIGYFVTAFVVDGLFQGATFCKYVCPIGQ